MARNPARQAAQAAIETPTTAALVVCTFPIFQNPSGVPDPDFINLQIAIQFNGPTGETANDVYFARNATTAQKQTAIRNRLNDLLAESEAEADRSVVLNNANIQIIGLPV